MDSKDNGTDLDMNLPTNSFSKSILKLVVGDQRANQVLNSMSMDIIPNVGGGSMGAGLKDSKFVHCSNICADLKSVKSTNEMGDLFKLQLVQIQKNIEKKT